MATQTIEALKINRVSRETYGRLYKAYKAGEMTEAEKAKFKKQYFIVKEPTLNALGEKVTNVATATSSGDAVNLSLLSSTTAAMSGDFVREINSIKESLIGNIIYSGHITIDTTLSKTLAKIFTSYIAACKEITEEEAEEVLLKNGFCYQITLSGGATEYTTADGIKLTPRDYIIINNHATAEEIIVDPLKAFVKVKDISRDNVDIIDINNDNFVKKADFNSFKDETTTNFATVSGRIDANDSSIEGLETKHSENLTRIGELQTALNGHNGRISALESKSDTMSGDINTVNGKAVNALGQLDLLTPRVTECESNITNLQTWSSQHETEYNTLAGRVTTAEGDITSHGNRLIAVEAFEPRISSAESTISVHTTSIAKNASDIATVAASAITNKANIEANASAISALQLRATNDETDIANNAADISDLQTKTATVSGGVNAVNTRIDALESGVIASHTTSISDHSTRISTAEGDIDTLEGKMNSAESNISDLQTRVGNTESDITDLNTSVGLKAPISSPTFTGTIGTPITASRVIVTDSSKNLAASDTTSTELDYVHGVTSSIQIQLNAKAPSASPTFTGNITTPITASTAVVTNASKQLTASSTTATELGYVHGVTSAIQTQINTKAPLASPSFIGTPTTPTAAASTNTAQVASTAFVKSAIKAVLASSDVFDMEGTDFELRSSIAKIWKALGGTVTNE